jgi:hypothetical protein
MAERKDIEDTKGEPVASAPQPEAAKAESTFELPAVEAPSISPAAPEPVAAAAPTVAPAKAEPPMTEASAPEAAPDVVADTIIPPEAAAARPRFGLRPRHKRYALLAASVTMAAAIGAVVGAVASGGFASPPAPRVDVAAAEESKAMQQSVARLAKEVTTLKANLEAANKASRTQIAKISEKLSDRLNRETAEVTGSISAPETTAPASQALAPVPTPRPAPRIAAVETHPPARPQVVTGWSIRDTRDGYIYVEGQGGIFQVVPGAPLPGLGPVESIKRQDGRWVVLTPKGIIVSMRDRRHFESF